MGKKIAVVSILSNVVLLTLLIWSVSVNKSNQVAAMKGDELHLELHESSLQAIESGDPQELDLARERLKVIVSAGRKNADVRRSLGVLAN